jgi:hypothetical protein
VTEAVLVAFASLSQVHRVRRQLLADGVYLDLVRVPKSTGLPGCGFGVRASRNEWGHVRAVAEAFGIEPAGAFVETPNGWQSL